MTHLFQNGWPWYISGPLIFLTMATLVLLGRRFGFSSNFDNVCSLSGLGRFIPYFRPDGKPRSWNLVFAAGAFTGGLLTHFLGASQRVIPLSEKTVTEIAKWGFAHEVGFGPASLMSLSAGNSLKTWIFLGVGGFCVGFGTRWAAGCTSGHGISGMSDLQPASFLATASFFAGGLLMVHFIFPMILGS